MAEHRAWMLQVITARTGTASLAEDVLQEVSLAVARSESRPTRADDVAPWLCKIVVRQCALAIRTEVRQQRRLDGFQQNRPPQDARAGDPIFWLLREEREAIVRRELAALEPPLRQALVWKYLHGLRYEEIAARLGLSRHGAEARVIQARKLLRRRLEARGIEGETLP
jgi:RNA polymerase sigma factor (sigma-70 family)